MKLTATTRDTPPTVTWEPAVTTTSDFIDNWAMPAVSAATFPSMSKTVTIAKVSNSQISVYQEGCRHPYNSYHPLDSGRRPIEAQEVEK